MSYSKAIRVAMLLVCISTTCMGDWALADEAASSTLAAETGKSVADGDSELKAAEPVQQNKSHSNGPSRTSVLIGSLTVFLLAVFVGVEVITKVPPTLHTPLMSGSNAISGITIVGAILVAGHQGTGGHAVFGSLLGLFAVILAMINVVGGFLVTRRMLMMFKKR